jgi:hypothetical protein
MFRYLAAFHDPEGEKKRAKGNAFIPLPNEHLRTLIKVNRDFIASIQKCRPTTEATLDMDATLIATLKEYALFGYNGFNAYQPFNVRWRVNAEGLKDDKALPLLMGEVCRKSTPSGGADEVRIT